MQYKGYGYRAANDGWSFHDLMPQLRRLWGRPKGVVLDIGCGNGAVARALIAEGYDVYGVDASGAGIEIANGQSPGRFHVLPERGVLKFPCFWP